MAELIKNKENIIKDTFKLVDGVLFRRDGRGGNNRTDGGPEL
jgi:hypothetical protein